MDVSAGALWMLILVLIVLVILFGLLWIAFYPAPVPTNVSQAPYGYISNTDGAVLNICGSGGTSPCLFFQTSAANSQTQCDLFGSRCKAFTFNPVTSTMKIINPGTAFGSSTADLYVRQTPIT